MTDDDDDYFTCPICFWVMPCNPELQFEPQYKRLFLHLNSHTKWEVFWHYLKDYYTTKRYRRQSI